MENPSLSVEIIYIQIACEKVNGCNKNQVFSVLPDFTSQIEAATVITILLPVTSILICV